MMWTLVVIWETGEKQMWDYRTEEEARAAGLVQRFVLQLFKLCHGDCLLRMFCRVLCG